MFNYDLDAASFAPVGSGMKGAKGYAPVALNSQPRSMQIQESFDNVCVNKQKKNKKNKRIENRDRGENRERKKKGE